MMPVYSSIIEVMSVYSSIIEVMSIYSSIIEVMSIYSSIIEMLAICSSIMISIYSSINHINDFNLSKYYSNAFKLLKNH